MKKNYSKTPIIKYLSAFGLILLNISFSFSQGQDTTAKFISINKEEIPLTVTLNKGVKIASKDDSFSMHIRFRIQNRVGVGFLDQQDGTGYNFSEIEARTRRARLRLDGHLISKKLEYHLQLSFSRADQDWDNSTVPNVLRDAFFVYKLNKKLDVTFGQTKLPGNRQRVISSGEQQFVDRSVVNATYTIDRDFLLMFKYTDKLFGFDYIARAAISNGEGRNSNVGNAGACYTGRLEILPFGHFSDGGDYYEADLFREPKPKLALAGGACLNDLAVRTGGQLGRELFAPTSMTTYFADVLFKYRGFSSYSEYMQRNSDSPITQRGTETRYIHTGNGIMSQLGYLFKSNYELAFRYALVTPDKEIYAYAPKFETWTLCASKYIKEHRIKVQTDISYDTSTNMETGSLKYSGFFYRLQLQLAI